MKINIFGRKMDIKAEIVIISTAALILLGCIAGYVFFRDSSDIIIQSGSFGAAGSAGTAGTSEQEGSKQAASPNEASGTKANGASGTNDALRANDNSNSAGNSAASVGTISQNGNTGVDNSSNISDKELIKVYVVGCVNHPGIVTLKKGQLIDDAIRLAGGLTNDANPQYINMVYELNENTMLYVKSKKELAADQKSGEIPPKNAAPVSGNINLGKGAVIIKDIGESAAAVNSGSGSDSSGEEDNNNNKTSYININNAGISELDTLPGIGEATARDIIAFREKNGPFRKIEDIMKVPRIKQNRFDSIKDFITVN